MSAFSMIELLFVIILIGILSFIAVYKFSNINHRNCVSKIAQNLQNFQIEISNLATKHYLRNETIALDLVKLFKPFEIKDKKCSFSFDEAKSKLYARSDLLRTEFTIMPKMPKSLGQNLRISCIFKDELCKNIKSRQKDK
ncbi:MAG: type II secretion system protein [Helicobacter sp.]|nr:type II secretion system protein [Helicobacter sp.]